MKCLHCSRPIESENDLKRLSCFKCHIKNVRLGFTYGKESFHGPTIREQQRFYEDSPAFRSGRITKIPDRAELI